MDLFGLGTPEIILILFILLLFFGKDKLPALAKSVGEAFKEIKKGFTETADTSDSKSKKS